MAKETSNQDIINARKAGMQLNDIAKQFGIDKMDVRDICKNVERTPKKTATKAK